MTEFIQDSTNHFLVSPFEADKTEILKKAWADQDLIDHVIILSSGTTGKDSLKSFALSKQAILANAQAVNLRFDIDANDRWLSSLPKYHIGGLSIFARAYLSGSEVIDSQGKWDASKLRAEIISNNIQYLSLVPTQLYDLVKANISAPTCLKGVFIGGDFASSALCNSASDLDWPLLITYGMSELSSQIATSRFKDMKNGFMEVLPIHKLKETSSGVAVDSTALFTKRLDILNKAEVKVADSTNFTLPDLVELSNDKGRVFLKPLGRVDDVIKISGRLFHLNLIKEELANELITADILDKIHLSAITDERLGKIIQINYLETAEKEINRVKLILNDTLKISADYFTFNKSDEFSKTSLGKIKKHQ